MFVVAGVSGKTGRVVAETLLARGAKVRVVVRDASKAKPWSALGAETAVASFDDERGFARALDGASGVYLLLPEDPNVTEFHAHRRRLADIMSASVAKARVSHVVLLSTTAAYLEEGSGPAKDLHYLEKVLRQASTALTVLRACYRQENVLGALPLAERDGIYPNFLGDSNVPFPTVAAKDIGRCAAERLLDPPGKSETLDLLGPTHSVRDMADALGSRLGKRLRILDIPATEHVEALLKAGMTREFAESLAEMFACVSSGRISPHGDRVVPCTTSLRETIARALEQR
jgi:uncharacterized protein YbjT (DUF2867 family)